MAENFSPTVVQPEIPLADITACELLFLSHVFQHDIHDYKIYFFHETGIETIPEFDTNWVRAALHTDAEKPSRTADLFRKQVGEVSSEDTIVEIDISVNSYEFAFQDIVRRSEALTYVPVTSSWVCTKMLPDGFGGHSLLITPERIMGKSTDECRCEMLDEAVPDWAAEGQKDE